MTEPKDINKFIDHLFRNESGKLVSILTGVFGTENIPVAEDVVQEAYGEAVIHWHSDGLPDNPNGWIYKVAKNKALNILKHEKIIRQNSSDVARFLHSEWTIQPALEFVFTDKEIIDSQLKMIFTCCHPSISSDSQVVLALKTLCGLSIKEIATCYLTNVENINKRLVRARKQIRKDKVPFKVPVGYELEKRLKAVLETIYLLFNEGYKASSGELLIKRELVREAIRLAELLTSHSFIPNKQLPYALLALMQLNASRFDARFDDDGNILTLQYQDRQLWNQNQMRKGFSNLQKSEPHHFVSKYHILADITAYHCAAPSFEETNWKGILHEYNRLIQIDSSPVVQLNRAIALSKAEDSRSGLESLQKITGLHDYQLYYSTEAMFLIELQEFTSALKSLEQAYKLASLPMEKELLNDRISLCLKKINK